MQNTALVHEIGQNARMHVFQNSRCHIKIPGARRVTVKQVPSPGNPQILGTTVQNLVAGSDMEPWDSAPYKNGSVMSIYITFIFHANVQAAQKAYSF
jgi:hypothetical protein